MPGISHEGKKGRCCCCRRCDPPDGRKNGKGGGPSGRRLGSESLERCCNALSPVENVVFTARKERKDGKTGI